MVHQMSEHLPEGLHDDIEAVLLLADQPRPDGEKHDTDPPHYLCLGDDPCVCIQMVACEQRVMTSDEPWQKASAAACGESFDEGYTAALDAAREAVAALHQRVPVIECACGWGRDCPECGSESNRIVGYACHVCCNSFGDHAYCDDLHYDDDDTFLHYQDGVMWSGPHCPTLAAIDALREEKG